MLLYDIVPRRFVRGTLSPQSNSTRPPTKSLADIFVMTSGQDCHDDQEEAALELAARVRAIPYRGVACQA